MSEHITVIGEALVDVVVSADGARSEHVGGSPTNVAIGLSRLGHSCSLATHIGSDSRGRLITEHLATEHVDLLPGSIGARTTSTAVATVDEYGDAGYEFQVDWQLDRRFSLALETGHIHAGSIAATLAPGGIEVLAALHECRERVTISYDPNIRPALMGKPDEVRETIEQFVALSDVVKASDEDVAWLYGSIPHEEILAHWTSLGPTVCALTKGEGGVVALAAGSLHQLPAPPAAIVDTVGAGDSFMAGLLSGLLDAALLGDVAARHRLQAASWQDIQPALDQALACAAITVSRAGSNPPRRAEL